MTLGTRTFLSVFLASAFALAVSTALVERSLRAVLDNDIRQTLVGQARLAASLLARQPPLLSTDAEADQIGAASQTHVTLIAEDGRVLGDSEVALADLAALDNHATREEVVEAARSGEGTFVRYSQTTRVETMYAAVRVRSGTVRYARMALPLTVVEERIAEVRRLAFVGLGAGLVAALFTTAVTSRLLNRRLRVVAETARRYTAGDFSRPVRDHGGDEIGAVANLLDSTARELGARLAEMARGRAHTDAILTGMVEGVLLVDRDARVVLTNPAMRSMLHLPDAPEGLHYLEVVRQPDIASMVAAALDNRPTTPVEVEFDRESRRRVMANVVPVRGERGDGAVLVLHDITDLRHADQVRRDFVANVSHELRTPLTAIRGYVEALLDAPQSPEQARQFLEVISRHAMRMERLVRDLLRLARLDAGQESIERNDCSVAGVITAVTHDLQPLLASRSQRVHQTIAAEAAVVAGDPLKLQDVLRNLIENAANYSPEGAVIDVSADRVGQSVEIAIADRGPGVPEADLPRIFERFYRVDRSRSRDPGGTGLGLSIVKHLVELHGGTVRAAPRDGGGAIFTVRLPGE